MPLQSSGPISFSQIKTELTSSSNSLRALSAAAGFSTPDAVSEFYSYSFITALPPTVSTSGASGVTNTQIIANGNVTDDGDATITERGFYFGTSTNRASNPKYVVSGTTGGFSLTRTGLSVSSTYRFWAYATNSQGTTYGAMQTAATYPTMDWSINFFNTGVQSQYFYYFDAATPFGTNNFYDELLHPYLGTVTLDYSSVIVGVDSNSYKGSRRFAQRMGTWGGTLANTRWTDSCNIEYEWWQNLPYPTYLVFQSRWNPDALTSNYSWTAPGNSTYGYGGYGGQYDTLSAIQYNLYNSPASQTTIWNTYVSANAFK